MNTLVISDLHIGTNNSSDLLRDEKVRECLKQQLATTERLVLLGDIVELRHGAPQQAVDLAATVLMDLSEALPANAEIIFVPGNHDHALINQWLKEKTQLGEQKVFGLEQTIQPIDASPFAKQLADAFSKQHVIVNYPGVWLREDCYATHGHYLDFHLRLPTIERFALSLMTRLLLERNHVTSVRDYEHCLEPVTAWIDTVSRWSDQRSSPVRGHSATLRKRLTETKKRSLQDLLLAGAFPAGVRVANRLGLGTFTSKLDGPTIRSDAIHAFTSVLETLSIHASSVIFGHTHRAGPLPHERLTNWQTKTGCQLYNCGSWIWEGKKEDSAQSLSPYRPGRGVVLTEKQTPKLKTILENNI